MNNAESRLQQACVRWVRYQYPDLVVYAIPNGGKRNAVTGAILKAEGVLAGVADLFVARACGGWHGLYVEMKTERGRQSESQKAFERAVVGEGYRYAVCRSFEDFERVVRGYLADGEGA